MVSKDNVAYTYLPESVGAFPYGSKLNNIIGCGSPNCHLRSYFHYYSLKVFYSNTDGCEVTAENQAAVDAIANPSLAATGADKTVFAGWTLASSMDLLN